MSRFFLAVFFIFWTVSISAMDVPANIQVPLLYKVLNFQKNIQTIKGDTIKIAIVFNDADDESVKVKDDLMTAFAATSSKKIKSRKCKVTPVGADADLSMFHVVYFTLGNDTELEAMLELCRPNNILTVTGLADYVNKGVILGLCSENNKPKLFINKKAAQLSKVSFSATLLSLARLI